MRKICILALSFLMIIGFSSMAGAAPTLSFQIDFGQDGTFETFYSLPPTTSVQADLYFTVTEEGVNGGGFKIIYDPSLMALSWDSFASPFVDTGLGYNDPGDLGLQALAFPPGTFVGPGQNKFASITLECLALGLGTLMIEDFNVITDEWVTSSGLVLDDQLAGGVFLAEVSQVPIPGAIWLLGSGLLGLVGLVRRQR